ncbi:MAG: tRNA preQ1(34) S-adenosylmethionine ribosyltransferase-isomerase QueA [Acidobacteria bacterium]|nr:MAG: tRNA preQ1(34) S-adenosylmethionine ribosyltransferase-isomerase QueA [Acidobacteriota bacterium]
MKVADFDYSLDPACIAQEPCRERDQARLLVLAGAGDHDHRVVSELPTLLRRGDVLVVNDTRVRHARLLGRKESGGEVEVLLLQPLDEATDRWSALVRASRQPRPGARLDLEGGITATVVGFEGERQQPPLILEMTPPEGEGLEEALERCGRVPLPPYIHRERHDPRDALDRRRYQTVFARQLGSSAAPTAGLHLSSALLQRLEEAGIEVATVTLHVGPGTFQPMRSDCIEDHRMHAEWCRLSQRTAETLVQARRRGGRIVAVGTTVVRTLEARWEVGGPCPGEGPVDLFLRPGHRFQAVDGLLTNFHLPRSTLLVLVAALAGRERILDAYHEAAERGYRFYSYGDAMLILP